VSGLSYGQLVDITNNALRVADNQGLRVCGLLFIPLLLSIEFSLPAHTEPRKTGIIFHNWRFSFACRMFDGFSRRNDLLILTIEITIALSAIK
jgi:hypothetical protein